MNNMNAKRLVNDLIGSFDEVTTTIENTFQDYNTIKEAQIYHELITFVDDLKSIVLFPKDSKHIKNEQFINILAKNLAIIFETKNTSLFLNSIKNSKNLIDALKNAISEGYNKILQNKDLNQQINTKSNFNQINQSNKLIKRR